VSNTHLNLRILNLIWKEEEEKEKNIAYLIPMMTAIKTAFLSDARELALEKRKNKRTSQRESRLDVHGIELKFPPSFL
jgi:hypothetical protein